MIIQANLVDGDGFIIEPVIVNDMDVLPVNLIRKPVPEGLYIPRWLNNEWVDDANDDYKQKVDNPVKELTEMELLKKENDDLKRRLESVEMATLSLMDFMP